MILKALLVSLPATMAVFVSSDPAAAWTCAERAARCEQLGGGTICFDGARMKACRKNHVYVAPSGRAWPVNNVPHGSRVKKKK